MLDVITWLLTYWWIITLGIIVGYILSEQISYRRKKGNLPGPSGIIPLVGGLIHMVVDPYKFWDVQGKYGKLSTHSLLGQFVVFSGDTTLSRKIFMSNSPSKLKIVLHPNAEILLGKDNIAFLQGDQHKELRKRLLPLFTKKALSVYLDIQENAIRNYLKEWLQMKDKTLEMRLLCRDLNVFTSQSVFVGPYLADTQRKEFADNYLLMNEGFLALPLSVPGTALYKAVEARKEVVKTLAECAKQSKQRMSSGNEPICLLDFWMVNTVQEIQAAKEQGLPAPPHSTDDEIANTTLDFLFAAQDASTASLVWVMTLLADHPDIFQRVREEQSKIRPNDERVTAEKLSEMKVTHNVMMEILRYRPPATMVPHQALENFQLTPEYTVPKGSLVIPSVLESAFQGWTEPYKFDPDRFSEERNEGELHKKNFLTFGHGSHKCMGYQYAMNHIMAFISIMVSNCDWERVRTDKSDDIVYLPTIYPGDGCLVSNLRLTKQKAC